MPNNDPITQALDRYFAQNYVAPTRADALRVAAHHIATAAPQPQPVMRAAPPIAGAKPMGGLAGLLFAAGNHVDNVLHASMQNHTEAIKGAAKMAALTALPELIPEAGLARSAEALPALSEIPARTIARRVAGEADPAVSSMLDLLTGGKPIDMKAVARAGGDPEMVARLDAMSSAPPVTTSNDMLRNMLESGFAGGKPATAVELPVAGAGRGGSTATAMGLARQSVDPATLRSMIADEIARRGGATSPEVTMAATEEVARKQASLFDALRSPSADSLASQSYKLVPTSPSASPVMGGYGTREVYGTLNAAQQHAANLNKTIGGGWVVQP